MTRRDPFEQRLTERLNDLAPAPAWGLLEHVMQAVDATPQRAARWPSRVAWGRSALPSLTRTVLLVLVLGVLAGLVATAAIIGSRPALRTFHLGKLAYASKGEIYVADADGGHSNQVTDANTSGLQYVAPSWWGENLVFVGQTPTAENTLFMADANGAGVRIIGLAVAGTHGPSPDGRHYAFLNESGAALRILATDGSDVALQPPYGYAKWDMWDLESFSWSPDGTELLVGACRTPPCNKGLSDHDLFLVPIDRSAPVRLSNGDAPAWRAQFSPDGSNVAFVTLDGWRSGSWDWARSTVDVMRSDGTGRRVVGAGGISLSFDWSPDGKEIAVVGGEQPSSVQIVDALGDAPPRRLKIPAGHWLGLQSWAPDGQSLFVVGNGGLWRLGLDGSPAKLVAANVEEAAWQLLPADRE